MPRVVITRGPVIEAVHPFSAVAVQGGRVVARWGPPIRAAWRSACKPFQLWCSLEAIGHEDFSDAELAVGASSHTGEPEHVALVRGLLARFELAESELRCGGHAPLYREAAEALVRAGQPFGDVHNNCSGKHTFMLAACRSAGWSGDYRDPSHPLQRRIGAYLGELSGRWPAHGVDGCGVPTWILPISNMARTWCTLAEVAANPALDPRLGRIATAFAANPFLTSGHGRLDATVMAHRREPMLVKIGAAALYCVALPARGMGVVVKVHSGDESALGVAVAASLERFAPGSFAPPPDWSWGLVRNVVGAVVGERRVEEREAAGRLGG